MAQRRAITLGIRKKSSAWDLELNMIIAVEARAANPTTIEGTLRILMA
jgi:hypothetical protein